MNLKKSLNKCIKTKITVAKEVWLKKICEGWLEEYHDILNLYRKIYEVIHMQEVKFWRETEK